MIQGYFNEFACLIFALPVDRTKEGCRWRQWFPQWNCRRPRGKALPDLLPWRSPTRICHRHLHDRKPEQKHFFYKKSHGLKIYIILCWWKLDQFPHQQWTWFPFDSAAGRSSTWRDRWCLCRHQWLGPGNYFLYLEILIIFGWWGLALITGLPFGAPSSTLG